MISDLHTYINLYVSPQVPIHVYTYVNLLNINAGDLLHWRIPRSSDHSWKLPPYSQQIRNACSSITVLDPLIYRRTTPAEMSSRFFTEIHPTSTRYNPSIAQNRACPKRRQPEEQFWNFALQIMHLCHVDDYRPQLDRTKNRWPA